MPAQPSRSERRRARRRDGAPALFHPGLAVRSGGADHPDEIGLAWQADIAERSDTAETRADHAATLQVPALTDGDVLLWDSGLIAEYLLTTYTERQPPAGQPPLAASISRRGSEWTDKRLFATIQTFGESIVLVSQSRWGGTTGKDNAFIARNGERVLRLIDWFESQLPDGGCGFFPDVMSAQDVFLICHLMFVTHRPLDLAWLRERTPKLARLHDKVGERTSFRTNSIAWWEPGMPG